MKRIIHLSLIALSILFSCNFSKKISFNTDTFGKGTKLLKLGQEELDEDKKEAYCIYNDSMLIEYYLYKSDSSVLISIDFNKLNGTLSYSTSIKNTSLQLQNNINEDILNFIDYRDLSVKIHNTAGAKLMNNNKNGITKNNILDKQFSLSENQFREFRNKAKTTFHDTIRSTISNDTTELYINSMITKLNYYHYFPDRIHKLSTQEKLWLNYELKYYKLTQEEMDNIIDELLDNDPIKLEAFMLMYNLKFVKETFVMRYVTNIKSLNAY